MNVSRRGYSFVEWNTTIDGAGKAYSAGDIIVINNHVNLYAQWKRDSESNTGSTFDNSSPYIGGSNIPPPVEPVIIYTFIWPIKISGEEIIACHIAANAGRCCNQTKYFAHAAGKHSIMPRRLYISTSRPKKSIFM